MWQPSGCMPLVRFGDQNTRHCTASSHNKGWALISKDEADEKDWAEQKWLAQDSNPEIVKGKKKQEQTKKSQGINKGRASDKTGISEHRRERGCTGRAGKQRLRPPSAASNAVTKGYWKNRTLKNTEKSRTTGSAGKTGKELIGGETQEPGQGNQGKQVGTGKWKIMGQTPGKNLNVRTFRVQ